MTALTAPRIDFRNIAWLTAGLALVAAPHVQRLPAWVMLLAAMLVLWRLYIGSRRLALPRKALIIGVVAVAALGVFLNYRTLFGRDAGVALLIVMLALKLLEAESRRDALLLIFMSYFLIVTNFLYSQTLTTALYMLVCLWIITAAMIACNQTSSQPDSRHQLRAAGLMLAQSAPVMLVLFLLFPRTAGPLWRLPQDAHAGVSGLSDSMSPGSVSQLSLSDAVAFRVEFKSATPLARNMYWRGPVLWDFDGRTWTVPNAFLRGKPVLEALSPAVEYAVTVEPHNQRWLFALDLPDAAPSRAVTTSDFQLRSPTPLTHRLRYEARSYLEYRTGTDERREVLQRALRLPENSNPRTVQFARDLRRRHASDTALIQEVLLMLRNEKFYYTLDPPLLGLHAVDEFLFDTRNGFCEHYASAFAVLMRAAGIPARIVTGYQGGQRNPFGNYYIVYQADAHAWTEVWLPNEGWVRVDPTAAVSPLRIQSGIAAAVSRNEPLPLLVRGDNPWLRQLQFSWDSLANQWNQWVLGYNPERQRWVLSRVGIDEATWRTLGISLVIATALIMLLLVPLMLRTLRAQTVDPAHRAYSRFCAKLSRKGMERRPAEGPLHYAARLSRLRPDLAAQVANITGLYVTLRYGVDPGTASLRELEQQVRQFSA
ncbi:MAG: transglutaminase TgpA family protein [Betaproteobacteria bacterium]